MKKANEESKEFIKNNENEVKIILDCLENNREIPEELIGIAKELDKYTDDELKDAVKIYRVYARVNPAHKERIVKALQEQLKTYETGSNCNI